MDKADKAIQEAMDRTIDNIHIPDVFKKRSIEQEFTPYEQALELKELGFDEGCLGRYFMKKEMPILRPDEDATKLAFEIAEFTGQTSETTLAPLYQQAFRWFREKYNMLSNVYSNASGFLFEYHDTVGGTHRYDCGTDGPNDSGCWDTYEEAELACLKKLIEIVKEKL